MMMETFPFNEPLEFDNCVSVSSELFSDDCFLSLTGNEKIVYLMLSTYILSQKTKKATIDKEYFTKIVGLEEEVIRDSLKSLKRKKMVSFSSSFVSIPAKDMFELDKEGKGHAGYTKTANEVVEFYNQYLSRKTKVTASRIKLVACRMKEGYTLEDLKNAIVGLTLSTWHVENNNMAPIYAFRNAETMDKCLDLYNQNKNTLDGVDSIQSAYVKKEIKLVERSRLLKRVINTNDVTTEEEGWEIG